MIFVYILQSLKDHGYYIGISKNLTDRLKKHNAGGVSSTSRRRPFKIVYSEAFESYNIARLREKEIKSYKGGNKLRELLA
ncbi:MAG TPA: GIY-YIG nuclease family protein [Patescibacteria group bacterium]|nr:GIY-YIG nuclease family protein [Patescibacteria group bacterium]